VHCVTAQGLKKLLPCPCTIDFLAKILKHAIQKLRFYSKDRVRTIGETSVDDPTVFSIILFGVVFVC